MKAGRPHAPNQKLTIEEVASTSPAARGIAAHRLCRAVPQ